MPAVPHQLLANSCPQPQNVLRCCSARQAPAIDLANAQGNMPSPPVKAAPQQSAIYVGTPPLRFLAIPSSSCVRVLSGSHVQPTQTRPYNSLSQGHSSRHMKRKGEGIRLRNYEEGGDVSRGSRVLRTGG